MQRPNICHDLNPRSGHNQTNRAVGLTGNIRRIYVTFCSVTETGPRSGISAMNVTIWPSSLIFYDVGLLAGAQS